MAKRLLCGLLCVCLLVALSPAAAAEEGQTVYLQSGSLDATQRTRQDIARLLAANPLGFAGEAMEALPSIKAPYSTPGKASQAALTAALNRFNALRWLARLPGVAFDQEMNLRAQYGAALLAVTGKATHHPEKPADMDSYFYQMGHNATSSSNVYQGTNATLPQAVEAFFDDSDAANLPTLGHRRWMLNPTMAKTGMGFAPSTFTYGDLTYHFATLWAFDRSGGTVNYDFVSWPASGDFPRTLFAKDQAWSVSLNPSRYAIPRVEDLTVTVSAIGKVYTLSGAQSYTPANTGAYLGVDTGVYGENNAIIFRPPLEAEDYRGTYVVNIQGITDLMGNAVPFTFRVDFFDPNSPSEVNPSAPTQPSQPQPPATGFSDVPGGAWFEPAVAYTASHGLFNGVGGGLFDPYGTTSRAMIMTVLARLDGEDTTPRIKGETWDIRGMRWAVTNRISDGLRDEAPITLEELVTMLYRYYALRHGSQQVLAYYLPNLPDGKEVSSWAIDGVNWAVDKGILVGDQDGRLYPQRVATRAQTAILLQRFAQQT